MICRVYSLSCHVRACVLHDPTMLWLQDIIRRFHFVRVCRQRGGPGESMFLAMVLHRNLRIQNLDSWILVPTLPICSAY
jgi:hypothetical protein